MRVMSAEECRRSDEEEWKWGIERAREKLTKDQKEDAKLIKSLKEMGGPSCIDACREFISLSSIHRGW